MKSNINIIYLSIVPSLKHTAQFALEAFSDTGLNYNE